MSELREVQICTYEIFKKVVDICEKNNITYYLSCGTLLGAVRHKGFIPWDNDIDIEMPLDDYKRFQIVAKKELPPCLFLQTYETDPGFRENYIKIRKNGTTSLPICWRSIDIHWGIGMDIFPIVGIPNSKLGYKLDKKLLGLCRLLISKDFVKSTDPDLININLKQKIVFLLPRALRIKMCKWIESVALINPNKSRKVTLMDGNINYPIPKKSYQRTKLKFEDDEYYAPIGYDEILRGRYGDYLTPPPENMRGKGHEVVLGKIIYEVNEDYSKFINKS